ncbi:sigma-54 interaction domain-containing protein [Sessilibacter sp. MAH2]
MPLPKTPQKLQQQLDEQETPAALLNSQYKIIAVNELYEQEFGTQAVNRFCYEVSHGYNKPCDQAGESCPLKSAIGSGQSQRVLHIHQTKQGPDHVDVEVTPVNSPRPGKLFLETMRFVNRAGDEQHKILGLSPTFTEALSLLNRAAKSNISVLLLGESGTGKELAARYLHSHSKRKDKPFVVVECSGLSETLFESELFGHEKGAFTGAIHKKHGLVEAANGGTLFLDELGDVPLPLQVKLLRLIETGSYRPVGSITEKHADFRLICATHQNLEQLIAEGKFRKDLFYRVSPFPVILPPLKERTDDIELLSNHLLSQMEEPLKLSQAALNYLKTQSFPGNIRELKNILARAAILCDGDLIEVKHLDTNLKSKKQLEDLSARATANINFNYAANKNTTGVNNGINNPTNPFNSDQLVTLETLEKLYLKYVSSRYSGDNKHLAKALGVSERTLYRKLREAQENE